MPPGAARRAGQWRVSSERADRAVWADWEVTPTPLPCFLEVLILNDFKSLCPEVLILRDFNSLFLEVLILVDFKLFIISELRNIEKFIELLILGWLGRAKCTDAGI
jgi:hypothetical protein